MEMAHTLFVPVLTVALSFGCTTSNEAGTKTEADAETEADCTGEWDTATNECTTTDVAEDNYEFPEGCPHPPDAICAGRPGVITGTFLGYEGTGHSYGDGDDGPVEWPDRTDVYVYNRDTDAVIVATLCRDEDRREEIAADDDKSGWPYTLSAPSEGFAAPGDRLRVMVGYPYGEAAPTRDDDDCLLWHDVVLEDNSGACAPEEHNGGGYCQ